MNNIPPQMAAYVSSLPGPYVGDRWATLKSPQGKVAEVKLKAWGQIATPDAKPRLVAYHLWNTTPERGERWEYVSWRTAPFSDEASFPTEGTPTDEEQLELRRTLAYLAGRA